MKIGLKIPDGVFPVKKNNIDIDTSKKLGNEVRHLVSGKYDLSMRKDYLYKLREAYNKGSSHVYYDTDSVREEIL